MTPHMQLNRATLERFMQSITKSPNGCWYWNNEPNAYGVFMGQPAHRASWELHQGPLKDGQLVLHGCAWKGCVNPAHLRPGTHQENAQDRVRHAHQLRLHNTLTLGHQYLSSLHEKAFEEEELTLELPLWTLPLLTKKAEQTGSIDIYQYLEHVIEELCLDNGLYTDEEPQGAAFRFLLFQRARARKEAVQ